MIPTNWLTVVLFLVLVAPGLLFDLLSERRRASVTESAFREASRVILASLIFDLFAFAVLAVIQTVKPRWIPDCRRPQHDAASRPPHGSKVGSCSPDTSIWRSIATLRGSRQDSLLYHLDARRRERDESRSPVVFNEPLLMQSVEYPSIVGQAVVFEVLGQDLVGQLCC